MFLCKAYEILLHVTTAYYTVQSKSSGYGNIECKGNETKLEECDVRKDVHLTCKEAVECHCSNSKISLLHTIIVNVYMS